MNKPLVSVWLITYNHAAYITQALEGVLAQQTSFAVELVIGDDYSTDGTRAIVQEYQQRYPDQIVTYLPECNLGMTAILEPTYALCRGKYVAMLDGDDYWTDPLKLQKQVDQLEADPTVRFSFHRASTLYARTGALKELAEPAWRNQPGEITLEDLMRGDNKVVTLSVLFRNDLGSLPAWYYQLPYPDLALYFLLLMPGGTARYLPDNMGVYRIHEAGWFSSLSAQHRYRHGARFFEVIGPYLPPRYQPLLHHELRHSYYELLMLAVKKGELADAAQYWLQLGAHPTTSAPHRPRPWPHRVLLTGLARSGHLLRQLGVAPQPNRYA